jgi:hypothetical protein
MWQRTPAQALELLITNNDSAPRTCGAPQCGFVTTNSMVEVCPKHKMVLLAPAELNAGTPAAQAREL